MRVAVIGHVEHITLGRVPRVPRPGDIAHATDLRTFPGGGGGIAFFQLVKSPGEVHLFTALGADEAAGQVRARLEATPARIHAAARAAPHTRDLVLITPDGERTIVVLGEPLHPQKRDPLPWEVLTSCDAAYFTAQDPDALRAARERLERMLEHCPNIRHNLAEWGAALHIIGKNQVSSDLPEHRHLKGKPFDGRLDVDQRSRGLGGIQASCGEENLLGLPGDRYAGRDICVHEFAHTIRAYGLSSNLRKELAAQFQRSTGQGLWKNAYAATNDDEFFAELSMWYFGTHGDLHMTGPKPENGSEGLKKYDPEAFALLDEFYSGRMKIEKVEKSKRK